MGPVAHETGDIGDGAGADGQVGIGLAVGQHKDLDEGGFVGHDFGAWEDHRADGKTGGPQAGLESRAKCRVGTLVGNQGKMGKVFRTRKATNCSTAPSPT